MHNNSEARKRVTAEKPLNRPTLERYGFAVLCTLLATWVKFKVDPLAPGQIPVLILPVTISAWHGGLGPGLSAAALAALIDLYYFIPPHYSFLIITVRDTFRFGSFVVAAVAVGTLTGSLHRARRNALQVAREKSQFLANISHEIRTPLHAIFGMCSLLRKSHLTPEQEEQIQTIQASARLMLGMTNDALDFSNLEAKRIPFKLVSFEWVNELRSAIKLLTPKAQAKGCSIELSFGGVDNGAGRAQVLGDPDRFKQILVNLLDNAIRFTPKGGRVWVFAGCTSRSPGRIAVKVEVIDQGPGIEPSLQKRIFEPYFQVDPTPSRSHEGVGLGLAICAELVRGMSGEIGVKSQPGEGARFWFTIELSQSEGLQPENESLIDIPPVPEPIALAAAKHRVLVVEDHPINQMVATRMIEKLGCIAEVAEAGETALRKIESGNYDLVLMDCHMPMRDGYEITGSIRQRETDHKSRRVPIVAMTANGTPANISKCFSSGMDDFLLKPVELEQLAEVLRKWLGDAQGTYLSRVSCFSSNGCDLVSELAQTFLSLTPDRLKRIRKSLESHDLNSLQLEAHALRSATAAVRADRMSAICGQIEDLSQKGDLAVLLSLRTELEEEFDQVAPLLSRVTSERV